MLPDRVLPQLVIILFFSFRVPTTSSFVQPQDDEEGGEKVEAWDSKITYILATVGYAVGLGKYKKNSNFRFRIQRGNFGKSHTLHLYFYRNLLKKFREIKCIF